MKIRLWQRREVWRLTWLGRLIAAAVCLLVLWAIAPAMYRGLAVSRPLPAADYVLFEGWLSDSDLAAALRHPAVGAGAPLVTTGGPIEHGGVLLPEYPDWARFARARLIALGAAPERVVAAPAGPTVRDRTYTAALAVRAFFRERGVQRARINLITRGAHARRSAMLYRHALGSGFEIGTIALPEGFAAHDWWRSSNGFRSVIYEWLALVYTRVFFVVVPEAAP